MRIVLVTFTIWIAAIGITIAAEELPSGWRFATDKELESFANWRDASPSKFTIADADFNGDGKLDRAYLAKSSEYSGQGLLVWLSAKNKYKWVVLDEMKWGDEYPDVGLAMGVEIMSPQKMITACGKGYWECAEGELPEITLAQPGIDYYKFGSASSVFYWNQTQSNFIRVWISD